METRFRVSGFEKLSGTENFSMWKIRMVAELKRIGLWEHIDRPETIEGDEKTIRNQKDRLFGEIIYHLDNRVLFHVKDVVEPKQLWEKLNKLYNHQSISNVMAIRDQIANIRMNDEESIESFSSKYLKLCDDLIEAGGNAKSDGEQLWELLSKLNDDLRAVGRSLRSNRDLTYEEAINILRSEELLIRTKRRNNTRNKRNEQAYQAESTYKQLNMKKNDKECFYCKKKGHIAKNCYKKIRDQKNKQAQRFQNYNQQNKFNNNYNKNYNKETANYINYENKSNNNYYEDDSTEYLFTINECKRVDNSKWIIDSGSSSCMVNKKEYLNNIENINPINIEIANGESIKCEKKGTLEIPTIKNGFKLKIENTLYLPNLSKNLISVQHLGKHGIDTQFKDGKCNLMKDDEIILKSELKNKLYYLNINLKNESTYLTNEQENSIWHQRMGHLNYNDLISIKELNLKQVSKLNHTSCEICLQGKQTKAKISKNPKDRKTKPLELIHSDICGPMETKTINGARYFITFIDDYSRYTTIYITKTKGELIKVFKLYKNEVENLHESKIKSIKSDNGSEYTSNEFIKFCEDNGIKRQLTNDYSPNENGVAERMNRTLVEMGRCQLIQANLEKQFWGESVNTANFIRNRSPSKTLPSNTTPYELWFNRKPIYKNMKTFGCIAYVHINKEKRKKLDDKSRTCIFIGYSQYKNGYKLMDLNTYEVIISRDVVFEENKFISENYHKEVENLLVYDNNKYEYYDEDLPENNVSENYKIDNDNKELESDENKYNLRTRKKINYNEESVYMMIEDNIPINYKQAVNSNDADKWQKAIQEEISSLEENKTWEVINQNNVDKNTCVVGSRWVFTIKRNSKGEIERYKARLVAKGYTQQLGINYFENYSPVARMDTMRLMICIAVQDNLIIEQMDVNTAFLYGELKENIILKLPEGFNNDTKYCKLKKSIYGLKQASRTWNQNFDKFIKEKGFNNTEADPCLYIYNKESSKIYLLIYVDDIILFTNSRSEMEMIKTILKNRYKMKELGLLEWYLGIKVKQERSIIKLNQIIYIQNLLKKFKMEDCKPVNTPMEGNQKLSKELTTKSSEEIKIMENIPYRSAVGALNYLSTCTRPDISYAVSEVARFNEDPSINHWKAVKRIFRYLKGTINYELTYIKQNDIKLEGFADADWAGDIDSRRSTSGYIFKMNGIISWKSSKQSCIALSTVEAEYVSLGEAAKEAKWLIKLLNQIKVKIELPITIFEDNQGTIKLAENPVFHKRTKHIDTRIHFVRNLIENNIINVEYCPTKDMVADILTKSLHYPAFNYLRQFIFS